MLSSCGIRVSVGDGFNLLANYLCEIIFKTSTRYDKFYLQIHVKIQTFG